MLRGLLKTGCAAGAIREVKELAMQEIDAIAAAEKQARAICEQAKVQAAELSAQAEKDGAPGCRRRRSSSCAQPDSRRTSRQRHSKRN